MPTCFHFLPSAVWGTPLEFAASLAADTENALLHKCTLQVVQVSRRATTYQYRQLQLDFMNPSMCNQRCDRSPGGRCLHGHIVSLHCRGRQCPCHDLWCLTNVVPCFSVVEVDPFAYALQRHLLRFIL